MKFGTQESVSGVRSGKARFGQSRSTGPLTRSSVGFFIFGALCLVLGLLQFYGSFYSIHQDLAGSALSGKLAVALGDAFGDYSMYFPPAEQAWFTFAARLSELTGLRLDLAVVLMTSVAVLISGGLAFQIRRETVGATPLFLIGSVAVLVILPVLFKNVFGLREHMVALGLWPYLVMRVSDPDDTQIHWKTRLLLGIWMGATLLFKYLYSIVVLLVELIDAAVQRRPIALFRIENLIAGGVVALYLFVWLVLDESQRTAIDAVVSAIDANLTDQLTNLQNAAIRLSPAQLFLLLTRFFKIPIRETLIGLAMVVGAIIAAWIQSRWYSHHLFTITVAYVAWWWIIRSDLKLWAHAAVAFFIAMPIVGEFRNTASYQEAVQELDHAMVEAGQSVAGKRVGLLTMHPSPFNQYLALQGALRWNASMNNASVAAELKPFDLPKNAGVEPPVVKLEDPGRQMLHDEMLRLWEDMPPDVLILDHSTSWPLQYVDVEWTHVFSQDQRFMALLEHYRPVLSHKGERLEFRYYVRVD